MNRIYIGAFLVVLTLTLFVKCATTEETTSNAHSTADSLEMARQNRLDSAKQIKVNPQVKSSEIGKPKKVVKKEE